MAALTTLLSGGWRISTGPSNLLTKFFSNILTGSTFITEDIVLTPTMSEFVVSLPLFSAPIAMLLQATNTVRINYSGWGSNVSAASAGVIQFKEAHFIMSQSGGLPSGIHLSNSGSDSATVTVTLVG